MKKYIVGLVSIFLFIMLSACDQENSQQEKIHVAEVTHSLFYAPFYVALSEGFFTEEGLNVSYQTVPGGDKTMTALLSDAVDIALVGPETSIYVYGQNAKDPVVSFAQLTQKDGTFLVARNPQSEFSFSQLKDSVFLGQRQGGMPQMVGEFVLRKHQIDPQRDLTLIQNIDFGNIPSAFISGTGDYVQLFEPTATIFEEEGRGQIVASFGEASGLIPYTVFMAKTSYVNQNSELVSRFTKAIYTAEQFVAQKDAATIAKAVYPYFKETDLATITKVIKRYQIQDTYAKNPIIDETEWQNLLEIMKQSGVIQADVPYQVLVNTEIAKTSMK